MKFNNKFNRNRNNFRAENIRCSCGKESKFHSKKNYPFGKKSKAVISQFYKCNSCGKITFIHKDITGGKK